jgi:hypothetical protein
MARSDQLSAPASASGGKAWVNQILGSNTVPPCGDLNRIEQIDLRLPLCLTPELRSRPARVKVVRKNAGRRTSARRLWPSSPPGRG